MSVRRVAHRWVQRIAAQVGTDVAAIYAISPGMLYRLITEGQWQRDAAAIWDWDNPSPEVSDDDFLANLHEMDTLIRQHGGAVFTTGTDGEFDVQIVDGPEHMRVIERGYLPPYGTPAFGKEAGRPIQIDKGQFRTLVQELYKFLKSKIPNRVKPVSAYVRGPGGMMPTPFTISYNEVGREYGGQVPLDITVGGTGDGRGREFVGGGSVHRRGYGGQRGWKYGVRINLFDSWGDDFHAESAKVVKELYSVLIHEMTHLRDRLERLKESPAESLETQKDPADYYNTPSEVRAFLQQVVDEVEDEADRLAEELEGFTTIEQLIRLSLEKSATWGRVKPHLNRRNKRIILKAVYRAVDDADLIKKYWKEDEWE